MAKKIQMVKCIALHDLSYLDHKGEPQYVRQGSRPIDIDKENFDFFKARHAVRLHEEAPVDEFEEEEKDDFADDNGSEPKAAAQKPADQKAPLSLNNKDKSK